MFPEMIKEDFKNPILASVAATFPMALMLLSTYIKPFIGVGAKYIWYFAIGLHIILLVYFTIKFLLKLQMPKVFASYFIVYVGIAVAAPAFEELAIGAGAFWFGFLTFIGLLVLVATMLYVLALVKAISYLKLKFYPSYAAFTFPFVISAIATADDGLSCEYEAADTDAPVCCSDRNGDYRIVYDLYLHSFSAVYFCRS